MDLQTKTIGGVTIKDLRKGQVTAVVSVLNVVDRDADVLLPGAISDGTPVKLSAYGHDVVLEGAAPVGKGTLRVLRDHSVVFDGIYFLKTARGADAFETVKELGADSEWSIGFNGVQTVALSNEWRAKGARRVIRSVNPLEVSPVFIAANQFTRTLTAKQQAGAPSQDAIAREFERARALVTKSPVVGRPLPSRFEAFAEFCRLKLGIFSDHAPAVKTVDADKLREIAGRPAWGRYDSRYNEILIVKDLDDDRIRAVLAHEYGHAAEIQHCIRTGLSTTGEYYAQLCEQRLVAEWAREQRGF